MVFVLVTLGAMVSIEGFWWDVPAAAWLGGLVVGSAAMAAGVAWGPSRNRDD